jgi:Putative peptidoglycan binding domain
MRLLILIVSFCVTFSMAPFERTLASERIELERDGASPSRPHFREARAVYEALPEGERAIASLALVAMGDLNTPMWLEFNGKHYDGIVRFQSEQGLPATGVLTPETLARLKGLGVGILKSWDLKLIDHPTAESQLIVPMGFGLVSASSSHGLVFDNPDRSMSIDYAYYPGSTLAELFANLTSPKTGTRIGYKALQPFLFDVAGETENAHFFSRYMSLLNGKGVVGFTLTWNAVKYPQGDRVAAFMANFLARERSDAAQAEDETPPAK